MNFTETKARYILLPDLKKDGECKMVDVAHIRAIKRLEAGSYELGNPDSGEILDGCNEECCILTISHESTCVKNWRDKSQQIIVPISMFELLSLINSKSEYHINGE